MTAATPPTCGLWLRLAFGFSLFAGCTLSAPQPEPAPPSMGELKQRCYPDDMFQTDPAACEQVAPMLLEAGESEEGVKLLGWACPDRPDACTELALLYFNGEHVPKDLDEGFKHAARGCGGNGADACSWVSISYMIAVQDDMDSAGANLIERALDRSCRSKDSDWGCYNYGIALTCGLLGKPDFTHAMGVLARGCTLGDGRACKLDDQLRSTPRRTDCALIGPDPEHPVELGLDLGPLPEGVVYPYPPGAIREDGREPFRRSSMPVR